MKSLDTTLYHIQQQKKKKICFFPQKMLSIRNADIFKAKFYYYYPIIITMTFVILQTFHTDEMVSLVTDIKKTHLFNFILS